MPSSSATDFPKAQASMLKEQLIARGIHDEAVLKVMGVIPRHDFVEEKDRKVAYEDHPIAIGQNQTISQPYIVALMTQLLKLIGDEKVLEIGTGSAYQTAILAKLAGNIFSLERIESLANRAKERMKKMNIQNVQIKLGDGSLGWPEKAPFDAIIVTAAAPAPPKALLAQLTDGARMVVPVGKAGNQKLQLWQKKSNEYSYQEITSVAFVPLIGAQGWKK